MTAVDDEHNISVWDWSRGSCEKIDWSLMSNDCSVFSNQIFLGVSSGVYFCSYWVLVLKVI